MGYTQSAADSIHPVLSQGGGVYSRKDQPAEATLPKARLESAKVADVEVASIETNTIDERDLKKKQTFGGWTLAWLAYQSTGVIYGDIGTSPLYVYSSTFTDNPSYDDLLGALSLIIWALTIMVTVKYILIVLNADDEGEGGTFALYSLVSRYARLVSRHPREEAMTRIERHETTDMPAPNSRIRSAIESSPTVKWIFKVVGVFGVALLLADGVLTPAQSILGAIQGLSVVKEDISNSLIVGVSCAILVVIFLVQPFGTTKLASTFAPIVIIWLLFNLAFGIYNLIHYDASVFKAFSPYFAGNFLVRNGKQGWVAIGGILLAFTGVEALFADLGAFSKSAIQISWLCFAYPCLLMAYIGQAAMISVVPSAYVNPFYLTVPPGMLYPSLVIAILACVVASQAVITGSFQIEMIHTSKIFHHQIYIPLANWIMMIGTVIVTAVYNNTTKLGQAYGTCVILVTFLTTCMVTIVAIIVWRFPIWVVLPISLIFALWDGLFLSAALSKVPDGAWFTLAVAIVLSSIFILWRYGKEQQWKSENMDNIPLSQTLRLQSEASPSASMSASASGETVDLRLQPALGGAQILPVKGLGIFFDKTGSAAATPLVFLQFLRKFSAIPKVTVFFHLRPLGIPSVPADERYTIHRCYASAADNTKRPIPNCYRMIVRHGYADEVVTPDLGRLVADQIAHFLRSEHDASQGYRSRQRSDENEKGQDPDLAPEQRPGPGHITSSSFSFFSDDSTLPLAILERAYEEQIVYIVGKEQLRLKDSTRNPIRRVVLALYMWLRENTRTKVQHLNVEVDRLVEVGFIKAI